MVSVMHSYTRLLRQFWECVLKYICANSLLCNTAFLWISRKVIERSHRKEGGSTSSPRLAVLPETFDGTKNWDNWYFQFENIAAVNGWNDAEKLRWLRLHRMGRLHKVLHHLPEASQETYEATRAGLKAQFDPESHQTLHQAEIRHKKANEGWEDFADYLKALADKGYPTLQDKAREQLTINAFLQQLTQPQIAFSVKQKCPKTLDDAVAATTLKMESYMTSPSQCCFRTTDSR